MLKKGTIFLILLFFIVVLNIVYRYKTTTNASSQIAKNFILNNEAIFNKIGKLKKINQNYFSGVERSSESFLINGDSRVLEIADFTFSLIGNQTSGVAILSLSKGKRSDWKVWKAILVISNNIPITILYNPNLIQ